MIRGELLGQANTKFLGRSIFAGNSDAASAYTDDNPPVFTGVKDSEVQRRVSSDTTIRVDADGVATFINGDDSMFQRISKITSALKTGGEVSVHLDEVNKALSTVIGERSIVAARHAELLRAKDNNANAQVDLEAQRSGVEDLDLGRAILGLKTQELAYQASLSVTAKVLQRTLMDFLR